MDQVKDQVNKIVKILSAYGDKVPQLKDISSKAGVETGVILGGSLTLALLTTFLMFGSTILTLCITVLYPACKSIQALESNGLDDDKEWLTYWIIFGLFSLLDDCCGCVLNFIPYFFWIKLAFFIALLLPQVKGAKFIYNTVVKDLLNKYKDNI